MRVTLYKISSRYFLTATLLLVVNILFAQAEKGQLIAGGSANVSESIQGTSTNFNFALQPQFGVFVINNLGIGGIYSFSAGSSRTLNSDGTHTTITTFVTLVGPFVKYYIGKKAMKPFISAYGGYSVYTAIVSVTGDANSNLINYDGFSTGGSAGIAYFFNPHVSFESALYLNASGYKGLFPTTQFGLSLGLYVFLDKKKTE